MKTVIALAGSAWWIALALGCVPAEAPLVEERPPAAATTGAAPAAPLRTGLVDFMEVEDTQLP